MEKMGFRDVQRTDAAKQLRSSRLREADRAWGAHKTSEWGRGHVHTHKFRDHSLDL